MGFVRVVCKFCGELEAKSLQHTNFAKTSKQGNNLKAKKIVCKAR